MSWPGSVPAPGLQVGSSGNPTRKPPSGPTGDLGSKNHRFSIIIYTFSLEPQRKARAAVGWQGYFCNFNLPVRSELASGLNMMILVPGLW